MLDDFLVRAVLAACGAALATGALGCFVVWRRMAYFGDATAHAAILGVALSLAFSISITVGVLLIAVFVAVLVTDFADRGVAVDTVLGVLSHGALALGLVAVALLPGARVDLNAYLFGDILTVSKANLGVIWGGGVLVLAVVAWRWQVWLTMTLSDGLARAAGVDPRREHLILALVLAAVVAVSIKVVGALLITALLIVPAAAARSLARGPEAMAVIATGIGVASAAIGLWGALRLDTPAGPTIICAALALFVATSIVDRLHR